MSLHNWLGSSALKSSAMLHGAAFVGTALFPQHWALGLGAVAANHALLTTLTLIPQNPLFGPNLTRLPAAAAARQEICLSFDDGPHPLWTPLVLDILDSAQAKASFFCVANQARQYPALLREIVARGHSVENHSFSHPHLFSLYGPKRIRREIAEAQTLLSDTAGVAPQFFRPPAGFANLFLSPVLEEVGIALATWTRRGFDTRDGSLPRVLNRLCSGLAAGDILLLHDANSASKQDHVNEFALRSGTIDSAPYPLILDLLPAVLQSAKLRQLRCVSLPQAFYEH